MPWNRMVNCPHCGHKINTGYPRKCIRCGGEWYAMDEDPAKTKKCPYCKSDYWNRPHISLPKQKELGANTICECCKRDDVKLSKAKDGKLYCRVCISVGRGKKPGPVILKWIADKDRGKPLELRDPEFINDPPSKRKRQEPPMMDDPAPEQERWEETPRKSVIRLSSGRLVQPKQIGMDDTACQACLEENIYLRRYNVKDNEGGHEIWICEFCIEVLERGKDMSEDCKEWLRNHALTNKEIFMKRISIK